MIIKMNTWQRLVIFNIVGKLQGDAKLVRKAGKLLDTLELSDDEKNTIGLKENKGEDGSVVSTWNEESPIEWTLEFKDPDAAVLLKETMRTTSLNAVDGRKMISVFDQLEI